MRTTVRMEEKGERLNGARFQREEVQVGDLFFAVEGTFVYHATGMDGLGCPTDYEMEFVVDCVIEFSGPEGETERNLPEAEALAWCRERVEWLEEEHSDDVCAWEEDRAERMVR